MHNTGYTVRRFLSADHTDVLLPSVNIRLMTPRLIFHWFIIYNLFLFNNINRPLHKYIFR